MDFIIESLKNDEFQPYFEMSESDLKKRNILLQTANKKPAFPCRITLEDAEVGEKILLLNYEFHKADSPYKASGPIYIRIGKDQKVCEKNEVPEMFLIRLISLRAYNRNQMLIFAEVFEGTSLEEKIRNAFENPEIDYLHIHNAKHGCYFASAKRL